MYMLPDTEGPVKALAALKHDQLLHIADTLVLDNNLAHALNMLGIDDAAMGLESESGGEHQIMNTIQPREQEVSNEAVVFLQISMTVMMYSQSFKVSDAAPEDTNIEGVRGDIVDSELELGDLAVECNAAGYETQWLSFDTGRLAPLLRNTLGGQPLASISSSSCMPHTTAPPTQLPSTGASAHSSPNVTLVLTTWSKLPQDHSFQTLAKMIPTQVWDILVQGPYLPEGSIFSTNIAALILQQTIEILSAASKAKCGNVFCAVTALLNKVDNGYLTSAVQNHLSPVLEKMHSVTIYLESTQLKLNAAVCRLDIPPRVDTMGPQPLPHQDVLSFQQSYAAVVAVPHAKTIADSVRKNCQPEKPLSLRIAMDEADHLDSVSIIAACHSRIFLHLEVNSANVAQWLKQHGILCLFGGNFDSTSTLVPSSFKLITEFVPTTYQPGQSTVYTDLEHINNLPVGSIVLETGLIIEGAQV
ncbi:hypothetical protein BDQ17DRAFT_1334328 [Cyathus striatus]|nr:hypothetical protein BDQ17DRAFT_1334328 [Cyathus striatus]